MKKLLFLSLFLMFFITLTSESGCDVQPTTDQKVARAQEQITSEGNAQVGMPGIHLFTEKQRLSELYTLRDDPKMICYAYLYNEYHDTYRFMGKCMGYGIPYNTQFSNPEKWEGEGTAQQNHLITQAEPNGLFPASCAGTWILMINPNDPSEIKPLYCEPNVIVSPWPLK
jgi:hypothetical protein